MSKCSNQPLTVAVPDKIRPDFSPTQNLIEAELYVFGNFERHNLIMSHPYPSHLKINRPGAEQELLLQAALLNGEQALAAWKTWCSKVDLQALDTSSYRLLPLLYHNLNRLQVKHPWLPIMRGVHRHTWVKNQTLLYEMGQLLTQFQDAGIEPLLLKGTALIVKYYDNFGLRPMDDFDVLVPRCQVNQAIEVLTKAGWEAGFRAPHAQSFRKGEELECDLHWNILFENCRQAIDDPFRQMAEQAYVNGVAVKVLNPTDQLLHVCVHGARWSYLPPLRWLADAVVILNHSVIDWERLVQQAIRVGVVLPLRDALAYLKWLLGLEIPETVLSQLNQYPVPLALHLDFRAWTIPADQRSASLTLWAYWREFVQWSYGANQSPVFWRFPLFLQHLWEVDSIQKVPWMVVSGGLRRVGNRFLGRGLNS